MAKNLTDLTARIATAGSDLLHINSGGTDYKQTKSNFMHGSLAQKFEVTSTLTSQVDALPIEATYFGCLWNYGHVSVTGMPINALSYVRAVRANSDQFAFIEVWSAFDPDGQHYIICKSNGTWESSWKKCASNADITSINNSLTNNSMTPMSVLSGRGTALDGGYCLVGNMVHINWKFKAGTNATNSPSISATPPSPKTEAALSCIDITSGISSAIDGSVPCGVSAVGTLYLKEIANNHIYAITGTYIKL